MEIGAAGLSHLDSATDLLSIRWEAIDTKNRQALDEQAALRALLGSGDRPLLVLRETRDEADAKLGELISRSFANERVRLASRWFRCVRVGDEVLRENHPLHALFTGAAPPRVILSSGDGAKLVRALGSTAHRLDWQDVLAVLRADYKQDANARVRDLQRILVELDKLDEEHKQLSRELQKSEDETIISRTRRLRTRLQKVEANYKKAVARQQKLLDLGSRHPSKAPAKGPAKDG